MTGQLTLEASLDGSVIRGVVSAPSGQRREFHGWLELSTAIEALLMRQLEDRDPAVVNELRDGDG
jgi:hypothetical protein